MAEKTLAEKPNASYSKDSKDVPKPRTMRDVLMDEQKLHPVIPVAAHLPANIDDPLPEPPVLTPLTPEEQKRADAKAALLKSIGELLAKYNHNESEIPANSPYWGLLAEYRSS